MTQAPAPIAFYAPLKSPHHPSPSGDRTMARLLMQALEAAGFAPALASECRALDLRGDPALQEKLLAETAREVSRLVATFSGLPSGDRPRLWFTYHLYYKAPDLIGPAVSQALDIPYVVAEGSRAAKRARGPWAAFHEIAEKALDRAETIFVMSDPDLAALAAAAPDGQNLVRLPPFLDGSRLAASAAPPERHHRTARLITVAMMRPGDKLASYRLLAAALQRILERDWTLDIIGDGPARAEVEECFARFGDRVRFHGEIGADEILASHFERSDLFVWPAVNEAYGMALLEAQALGCPVVAGAYGGVASVVRAGETGLLVAPGDVDAFAEGIRALLDDRVRRLDMARAAASFVHRERNISAAAEVLRRSLAPLIRGCAA
jgi:glycosyltransferase involved in cell wall biosynthesis